MAVTNIAVLRSRSTSAVHAACQWPDGIIKSSKSALRCVALPSCAAQTFLRQTANKTAETFFIHGTQLFLVHRVF